MLRRLNKKSRGEQGIPNIVLGSVGSDVYDLELVKSDVSFYGKAHTVQTTYIDDANLS